MRAALVLVVVASACTFPEKRRGETDAAIVDAAPDATDAAIVDAAPDATDAPTFDAIDAPSDAIDAPSGPPVLRFEFSSYTIAPNPVLVGGPAGMVTARLFNDGGSPAMNVTTTAMPSGEVTATPGCTMILPATSCDITLRFAPTQVGTRAATITANATGVASTVTTMVSGTGAVMVTVVVDNVGTVGGRVSSTPAGINCPGTCAAAFTATSVTLTESVISGDGTLANWSNGCSVDAPCTLSLATMSHAVTAQFKAAWTYQSGSVDGQLDGVTFAPDGTVYGVGRTGASSALLRIDGTTGVGTERAGTGSYYTDVVATSTHVTASGVIASANDDSIVAQHPIPLAAYTSAWLGPGVTTSDATLGICAAGSGVLFTAGYYAGTWAFGKHAAIGVDPALYYNTSTTPLGVGRDLACDAAGPVMVGDSNGASWIVRLNASGQVFGRASRRSSASAARRASGRALPLARHKRPPPERPVSRVLFRLAPVTIILLGPPLPAGSSDQPGVIVRAARPLSGLASGGVCRAPTVTRRAVRSYRTVSPLPRLATRRSIFCGTFLRVTSTGR